MAYEVSVTHPGGPNKRVELIIEAGMEAVVRPGKVVRMPGVCE